MYFKIKWKDLLPRNARKADSPLPFAPPSQAAQFGSDPNRHPAVANEIYGDFAQKHYADIGDNGNGYPGLDGDDGVIYYLKTWLTSVTNPDQELFYTDATPTMEMAAAGDIFGYFYEVVQDPNSIADQTSDFTSETSTTLDSLSDGTW